jgi:hypothetical protein
LKNAKQVREIFTNLNNLIFSSRKSNFLLHRWSRTLSKIFYIIIFLNSFFLNCNLQINLIYIFCHLLLSRTQCKIDKITLLRIYFIFRIIYFQIHILIFRNQLTLIFQFMWRISSILSSPTPTHIHIKISWSLMIIFFFIYRFFFESRIPILSNLNQKILNKLLINFILKNLISYKVSYFELINKYD